MRQTIIVLVAFLSACCWTQAFAGCPYRKKTCPVNQTAKDPSYQTAESVSKKYQKKNKTVSQSKKVKVQTADEVLKTIEQNKKAAEREQSALQQSRQPAAPSAVRSRPEPKNNWQPKSSRRKKLQPVTASPSTQEAMQSLAGQPRGYTVDAAKQAQTSDVSSE
jgi:FtsZ-interacting cell division protein ZipA